MKSNRPFFFVRFAFGLSIQVIKLVKFNPTNMVEPGFGLATSKPGRNRSQTGSSCVLGDELGEDCCRARAQHHDKKGPEYLLLTIPVLSSAQLDHKRYNAPKVQHAK